ncbi:MAG: hypothetical protein Q8R81_15530 [Novosphingobium sp.]|uniref:hypothetical protein n=1 Tax=Novosphingobium sp. TaxID=1874826 RepID=UPI0027324A94|nr:hypothetical protein [Novosphingobium sp.]MDP3551791.1 hypothetical protein [Novosphingobium sp.]
MSSVFERLQKGERYWPAEIGLRTFGIVLLAGCGKLLLLVHHMVNSPPSHEATVAEFGLCAVAFVALTCGLGFTIEGPGLFRWVPIPPRSLIS